MSREEKRQKYEALLHAMQTGVAYKMAKDPDPSDTTPKHLRVGINAAMVEHAALAELLIDKGLITEDEYLDALIAVLEREVAYLQRELPKRYEVGRIYSNPTQSPIAETSPYVTWSSCSFFNLTTGESKYMNPSLFPGAFEAAAFLAQEGWSVISSKDASDTLLFVQREVVIY